MFRTGAVNPFDEAVTKATDENLTAENWELILDVCDKVDATPEDGPRDAIIAVTKRFAHRNANVQLYALTLAEALGKNCGTKVHREIASKAFTQAILRLINDRTTHATVKSRAYELVASWAEEFKKDPSLGIMDETLRQLKASNPNIQPPSRPQKREITDADRKKEEEELQMALAMSLSDTHITKPSTSQPQSYGAPQQQPQSQYPQIQQQQQQPPQKPQTTAATVSRVKALYDFSPSEPSELPFRRGDIISVLDSVYKDWWRGSLRGQTGIFPVNYVEILKDATPEELMREAEEESKILAEGRNIEKLLGLLANAEGGRGVEDEDLQGLYNSTLAIRPKLVKLIEKYSMRKDELIALNEKFHKARHDYDVLMESSMSRYAKPAPAPSTNPFGQAAPYQSQYSQPIHRPTSGFGIPPNPTGSPPPSGHGYPPTNPAYPPTQNNWDPYQAKPWESAAPPAQGQQPPQPANPWETHQPNNRHSWDGQQQQGAPAPQWEGQQQPQPQQQPANIPTQWENQYQAPWDQERPAAPSTYQGPPQTQAAHHYGGGLDELAAPIGAPPTDKPQQQEHWYNPPTTAPGGNVPYKNTSPLPTTNTGTGGFTTQTAPPSHAYFSPQQAPAVKAESRPETQPPYPYSQASEAAYVPPQPSQAPPAIPLDQKPQTTPYPVGQGQQPFYTGAPKPPATYMPQAPQGDRYASLRSLSPQNSGDGSAWYPPQERKEEAGKPAENGAPAGSGYYGVT